MEIKLIHIQVFAGFPPKQQMIMIVVTIMIIRDGVKKSKWKFKMAFAIRDIPSEKIGRNF